MNRKPNALATAALAAVILWGALLLAMVGGRVRGPVPPVPRIPACAEDTVIVGTGDYAHGRWTAYVCGPARDDMVRPLTNR